MNRLSLLADEFDPIAFLEISRQFHPAVLHRSLLEEIRHHTCRLDHRLRINRLNLLRDHLLLRAVTASKLIFVMVIGNFDSFQSFQILSCIACMQIRFDSEIRENSNNFSKNHPFSCNG